MTPSRKNFALRTVIPGARVIGPSSYRALNSRYLRDGCIQCARLCSWDFRREMRSAR